MNVKVYATLRLKAGIDKIAVRAGPGDTVRDVIREVLEQYPILTPHVMTEKDELSSHVHIFLGGRNIRLLDGLDSVIQEGQQIDIFPPVAGGLEPGLFSTSRIFAERPGSWSSKIPSLSFTARRSCGIIPIRRDYANPRGTA